ncbi:hypothetical protein [Dyadobacter jiangsuensis]|uniref:Uncharacterized protein n=1 Tax=Dyadobacter jiangsuensis TaxID=1591085 RepID=A0A2P8GEY3_9BACT|nr:hypothetical protein [Dyadobacter jiangsuensis]PSL32531.1 hypothetical protein CLV60_102248 [Dyadobacter jiangsuensis]
MKVIELIRIIPETLWAARFEGNEENEFDRAFNCWNDSEYLDTFFTTHEQDLVKDFYGYCSVSQAISITLSEADEFERQLLSVAQGQESGKRLGDIFKPLDKAVRLKIVNEKSKAYGTGAKSWLRIYAVRLNYGFFVISGSAIKLTKTMTERTHLKEELTKLDVLVKFLKELNIETVEDWGYIDFE